MGRDTQGSLQELTHMERKILDPTSRTLGLRCSRRCWKLRTINVHGRRFLMKKNPRRHGTQPDTRNNPGSAARNSSNCSAHDMTG
jgi:hypothetical protein